MTLESDTKFEEELSCSFKIDIRNLTNFDSSTRKSKIFAAFDQSICLNLESAKELSLTALKIDAKVEGKLTCASKSHLRNLTNFQQSTRKFKNWNFNRILLSKVENV